jgi:hypothetical protein
MICKKVKFVVSKIYMATYIEIKYGWNSTPTFVGIVWIFRICKQVKRRHERLHK